MKTIRVITDILVYEITDDLPMEEAGLLREAHLAQTGAYAPYSGYHVGAALLLGNGQVITGNNQENMAYPSGLCAERVAIFWAGSRFPGVVVKAMAIVAGHSQHPSEEPGASCGACRQAMLEYELKQGSPIRLIMQGHSGAVHVVESVSALLPLHFNEERLKQHGHS